MNVIDMHVQETAESYLSSLLDLTSNNKSMINVLTILAEENIKYGQAIVDTINQRINEVKPDSKLPILYLIDSILKNLGGKYIEYFEKSIVSVFVETFRKVNADIRKKLYELRQTWNGIFPRMILIKLDAKVNATDPNWLISKKRFAEGDGAIVSDVKRIKSEILHGKEGVDLRVLQPQNKINSAEVSKGVHNIIDLPGKITDNGESSGETIGVTTSNRKSRVIMQPHRGQQPILCRRNERAKLMINLSDTNKNNKYPLKTFTKFGVSDTFQGGSQPQNNKWISPWDKQMKNSTNSVKFRSSRDPMNRANKSKIEQNFQQIPFVNRSLNSNHSQILPTFIPKNSIVSHQNKNTLNFSKEKSTRSAKYNQRNGISEVSNKPVEIDVQSLFKKLQQFGMINSVGEKPALDKPETLKKRNPSAVSKLYSGWQCSSCGIRFPLDQTTKHQDHLDWHFQQNRRENNENSQKWYSSTADWAQADEVDKSKEKNWFEIEAKANATLNMELNQPIVNCIAAHDEHNKVCDICSDPFEMFYDHETEDWFLRNAIRKGKNVYHPICYEDY